MTYLVCIILGGGAAALAIFGFLFFGEPPKDKHDRIAWRPDRR